MGAYHFHRVPTIISQTICEEIFFELANYIMWVKLDHRELLHPQNTWNSAPAMSIFLQLIANYFARKTGPRIVRVIPDGIRIKLGGFKLPE